MSIMQVSGKFPGRHESRSPNEASRWLEKVWPRRGDNAPWCDGKDPDTVLPRSRAGLCRLKAQFVYHVGVQSVGSYCPIHADELVVKI